MVFGLTIWGDLERVSSLFYLKFDPAPPLTSLMYSPSYRFLPLENIRIGLSSAANDLMTIVSLHSLVGNCMLIQY